MCRILQSSAYVDGDAPLTKLGSLSRFHSQAQRIGDLFSEEPKGRYADRDEWCGSMVGAVHRLIKDIKVAADHHADQMGVEASFAFDDMLGSEAHNMISYLAMMGAENLRHILGDDDGLGSDTFADGGTFGGGDGPGEGNDVAESGTQPLIGGDRDEQWTDLNSIGESYSPILLNIRDSGLRIKLAQSEYGRRQLTRLHRVAEDALIDDESGEAFDDTIESVLDDLGARLASSRPGLTIISRDVREDLNLLANKDSNDPERLLKLVNAMSKLSVSALKAVLDKLDVIDILRSMFESGLEEKLLTLEWSRGRMKEINALRDNIGRNRKAEQILTQKVDQLVTAIKKKISLVDQKTAEDQFAAIGSPYGDQVVLRRLKRLALDLNTFALSDSKEFIILLGQMADPDLKIMLIVT